MGNQTETNPKRERISTMDKIRVSRSIMDSLNKTGYAVGKWTTGSCTRRGRKAGDDEIIAYYHDGEF